MADVPSPSSSILEAQLSRLPELNAPSPAMLNARRALVDHVHAAINPPLRPPVWQVLPFGSTVTRIDSPTSDLDLTITRRTDSLPIALEAQSPDSLPDVSNMRVLGRLLRRAGVDDVQPILRARVPIVKCSWASLVRADINCEELLGVENSHLIASYADLCPILRPLAVAVKLVLKTRGVCGDPAGHKGPPTLSSYAVVLLVISFLQRKGMLPNLQDVDLIQRSGVARRRVATRQGPGRASPNTYTCDVTYVAEPSGWVAPPAPPLAASFAGFWAWLSGFDWSKRAVAVDVPSGAFDRDRAYQPPPSKAESKAAKKQGTSTDKASPDQPAQVATSPEVALAPEAAPALDSALDPGLEAALDPALESAVAPEVAPQSGPPDELDLPVLSSAVQPKEWERNPVVIKDPFLHHRNTAKAILPKTAKRIVGEARRAHQMLTRGGSTGLHQLCEAKG